MAELSPQSAVEVRIAAASIRLSRVQLGLRKIKCPRHTDWIDALEDVENPKTATQILKALLDSDEAPYQLSLIHISEPTRPC